MWEAGGGCCNTGDATILAKPDGTMPTAVYVRQRGHLSCGEHALVPLQKGYYIVCSNHHRGDFEHRIYKVLRTFSEGENKKGRIEAVLVNKFDQGEWDTPLDPKLEAAVAAAEEKATNYHCREAVYVKTKER